MRTRFFARTGFFAVLIALTLLAGLGRAPLTAAAAPADLTVYSTGYSVAGQFQRFFYENGGVEIFGLPLTDGVEENGLLVQYFERNRFEYHPEYAGTENEVLLGLLGRDLTQGRAFAQGATGGAYFPETGYSLGGAFSDYWWRHNGIRLFGYPISNEVRERSIDDGHEYTVQYFERARMEWHPENQAPYNVLLGRLGAQVFVAAYQGRQPTPANRPAAPQGPSLNAYEQQVLQQLMDARSASGAPLPQLDQSLVNVSRERSADMANRNYFSHSSPEGANVFTLLNDKGVDWRVAGEIIARNNYGNDQTATVAAQAYLNSPGHRAVVMDPQYNYVGIGHAVDGRGMHYFTLVFVRR